MSDHQVESTERAALRRRAAENETGPSDSRGDLHPLLRLQSQVGNAQIARLLAQRQEEEEVQAKHDLAQRQEEEEVQAKHETVGVEGGEVGPDTAARIDAARGGGSPLDTQTRVGMESAFGTSFSDVRVHADSESDTLSQRLTAKAFTTGSDVFLRRDSSPSDTRLLAHELTHVVQQRQMSGGGTMRVGAAGDSHEQHADAAADLATSAANGTAATPAAAQREAAEDEVQASHDLAQRQEEEEVQASHDLAQRQEEEEVQANHDLAQRQEEEEVQASHDLAQRQGEEEVQASHDLAQRQEGGEAEEEEVMAKHDLAQRQEDEEVQASHDLAQRQEGAEAEEEEVQAKHDLAQRHGAEEAAVT